jgi:hypothetical protein
MVFCPRKHIGIGLVAHDQGNTNFLLIFEMLNDFFGVGTRT